MPGSNTSSAYNFALFEEKERLPVAVHEPPALEVVHNPAPRDRFAPMRILCVALMVVAVVATMIYSRVMLTEVSAQVSENRKELELMQSEYTRMLVELEGQTSDRSLETKAIEEYGLSKVQGYQVEYVNLTEGDELKTVQAPEDNLLNRLASSVSLFVEYIAGK